MSAGRFIVIYGVNNMGKSTQVARLVQRLNDEGHPAQGMKYPVYDIEPSGVMINDYLRHGNPYQLSFRENQLLQVINKMQAAPELQKKLDTGLHVVAEDYSGTSIAWGMGTDVDEAFMKRVNSHLMREDLVFYLTGKRFVEATEETHIYETKDDLQERVNKVYERLGPENGWIPINANRSIEEVHEEIWSHVKNIL